MALTMALIFFIHSKQKANLHRMSVCVKIMTVFKQKCLRHITKSMKTAFAIYTETESLFAKLHTCDNDPEKFSTSKISMV